MLNLTYIFCGSVAADFVQNRSGVMSLVLNTDLPKLAALTCEKS